MAISDNDLFLVNTSDETKTVKKSELMTKPSDNDYMLVNKASDNQTYKVKFSEVKDELNPSSPPVFGAVNLAEDNTGGDRFTSSDFTTTVSMTNTGAPPAQLGVKATLDAKLLDKIETDPIAVVAEVDTAWNVEGSRVPNNTWNSVCFGKKPGLAGMWVATSAGGYTNDRFARSTDGINWSAMGQGEGINNASWNCVCFGECEDNGGRFVAVSENSGTRAAWSGNGEVWNPVGAQSMDWTSVTYGAGLFVAVAKSGSSRAMYSTNGENWTATNLGLNNLSWQGVAYGDGIFVAIAENTTTTAWSTNGTYWNVEADQVDSNTWSSVAYGNGVFVAVSLTSRASPNRVARSTDGKSWEMIPVTGAIEWTSVTYGAGVFVAVAKSGENQTMWSSDGITWNLGNFPSGGAWGAVGYGNGMFAALATNSNSAWGLTGGAPQPKLTFTGDKDLSLFLDNASISQSNGSASGIVAAVDLGENSMRVGASTGTWLAGQTVVGPQRLLTSDPITAVTTNQATTATGKWEAIPFGNTATQTHVCANDDGTQLVVTATYTQGSAHYYSNDGVTFTAVGPGTTRNWCAYGKNLWVSVGYDYQGSGTISWSNDPRVWNKARNVPSFVTEWASVSYGNNTFVAVPSSGQGESGTIAYSADGDQWQHFKFGSYNMIITAWGSNSNGAICVGSTAQYMAYAYGNNFLNWNYIDFPEADWRDMWYHDGLFVAVKPNAAAWSEDGLNWNLAENVPKGSWRNVTYGGGVWCASNGQNGPNPKHYYMCSFDGKNWFVVPYGDSYTGYEASTGLAYAFGKFYSSYTGSIMNTSVNGYGSETVLTFSGNKNLDGGFAAGNNVVQNDGIAKGSIKSTNAGNNQMTLAGSDGLWRDNQGFYVIGPPTPIEAEATLYANLDSSLNVIDLQSTDPGFTNFSGTQPKVKFPAVLPDGQSPDATLLEGTDIYTTVQANNLVFAPVTKKSNVVTPGSTRTGFNSNNSAEVAEFQVVKESLDTYEEERDTRRSNFAQALRNANFSDDQIKSVGLE